MQQAVPRQQEQDQTVVRQQVRRVEGETKNVVTIRWSYMAALKAQHKCLMYENKRRTSLHLPPLLVAPPTAAAAAAPLSLLHHHTVQQVTRSRLRDVQQQVGLPSKKSRPFVVHSMDVNQETEVALLKQQHKQQQQQQQQQQQVI